MKLPDQSWENPLKKIQLTIKNRLPLGAHKEFEVSYRRFNAKLIHLGLIWERLKVDIESNEKRNYHIFASTKTHKLPYTHTPEEESVIQHYTEKSKFIHLDFEDFFIHADILMGRVAWLTRFFLKGVTYDSFSDLRKFFLNNPFPQDEQYTLYIREKTTWYETLLKGYRDKLIVHDTTSDMGSIISSPKEVTTIGKARMRPLPKEKWNKQYQRLMKLRDKYKDKIPRVSEIPVNVFELIRCLDAHGDLIDPSDLRELGEIRHQFGTKLPNVNAIANHIMDLLNFYTNHFSNLKK
jgi:hypothetical protein